MSSTHKLREKGGLDRASLHEDEAALEQLTPMHVVDGVGIEESDLPLKSGTEPDLSDSLLSGCRRHTWTPHPEMTIFFGGNEQARGTEEFRSLRSRLYQIRKEKHLKSILVASALPREGRSFVAANLAQVLALQAGCKVLMIDADLRNPKLHSAFGTVATPGLSDYLLQEADEFAVMQRGSVEGLFLIPSGRPVKGQAELVANGRLKSLIDQVDSLFDWIIVDSPAAIPLTDACLLAGCCDRVLLVVRSHSTPFDVVQKARDRFREESLLGVFLNRIDLDCQIGSDNS
jgi:capsular exopolysaccharide synthesis family protein